MKTLVSSSFTIFKKLGVYHFFAMTIIRFDSCPRDFPSQLSKKSTWEKPIFVKSVVISVEIIEADAIGKGARRSVPDYSAPGMAVSCERIKSPLIDHEITLPLQHR